MSSEAPPLRDLVPPELQPLVDDMQREIDRLDGLVLGQVRQLSETVNELNDLVQALTQLKELRAAARYVAEDACSLHHALVYPGEMVVQGRGIERLKAALEGKSDV